ncbi:hypothetical protein [Corallococcus carmarthensis]|uniref:Lipoprotein n=1 Tax=Corallococcus carmarthensis TaxID=2316728 RepID=A0A3A8KKB1_9BACT|nr:hypothetical protein [Corallococcus carmarthensis]NOK16691.1 hypothetical protein [Corallococcus carmarthensis]RKH07837.1 hypothetical protein D7X32_00055 [Corallococcus carmarthensis]
MLRRFVSYAVPAAALLLGACGGPEVLDAPESPAEPSVATTEQGLSTITINDFPLSFYVPPKTGGDADFAGHGPLMQMNFELEVRSGNQLWVGMFIWGTEVGGTTKVQGGQWYHIATTATPIVSVTPSPCPIADYGVFGPEFNFEYTDTGHSQDAWGFPQLPSNTRIVQTLTCVGDTSGDEAGTKTGCSAILHDLTLTF